MRCVVNLSDHSGYLRFAYPSTILEKKPLNVCTACPGIRIHGFLRCALKYAHLVLPRFLHIPRTTPSLTISDHAVPSSV